jgi:hypothetical protein
MTTLREARIMDAYFGRKLPEMLLAHGLELELAEIDAAIARFGEPEYEWTRITWLQATAKLVAAGMIDAAIHAVLEEFFSTPGTALTSITLVAAGARKPT